jgi:hypothetical protein
VIGNIPDNHQHNRSFHFFVDFTTNSESSVKSTRHSEWVSNQQKDKKFRVGVKTRQRLEKGAVGHAQVSYLLKGVWEKAGNAFSPRTGTLQKFG